ncbi:hypothetical protein HPP92_017006 [Vanilla planifolia]|uniref:Uncharacterized protein n=1 Tax=Vanilla planifolia TaxID=51239 RepID=A0A835QFU4_VANPL|nr:hypothetical protein HPP92_017006 [Vanilla planifolia]
MEQDSTDEAGRSQQSVLDAIQLPLIPGPHQTNQTMGNSSSLLPNGITPQFTPHFNPHQLHHHQHAPQQHMQRPDQQLQLFWANQL